MMEIEGLSARCTKHPLDTISVAGSYYRRNLEAHRFRHNREFHPRGHRRENARREEILEQITPAIKELGKTAHVDPDTDQWGDAPVLSFDPGADTYTIELFKRTAGDRMLFIPNTQRPYVRKPGEGFEDGDQI